jgi:hypothetical protein
VVSPVQHREKATRASAVRVRTAPRVAAPTPARRSDDLKEMARIPKMDESTSSDTWRLTTQSPPNCSLCRRRVNPEFIEIVVDRKVWVFCGKRCRLQWKAEHFPLWEAESRASEAGVAAGLVSARGMEADEVA